MFHEHEREYVVRVPHGQRPQRRLVRVRNDHGVEVLQAALATQVVHYLIDDRTQGSHVIDCPRHMHRALVDADRGHGVQHVAVPVHIAVDTEGVVTLQIRLGRREQGEVRLVLVGAEGTCLHAPRRHPDHPHAHFSVAAGGVTALCSWVGRGGQHEAVGGRLGQCFVHQSPYLDR